MRFHKYHAAGNDFIVTDEPTVGPADAPRLCDRRTGIGADGLLLHRAAERGDARMIVVNADGSVAEMCGNGLRCFCRYLIEQQGVTKKRLSVETGAGPIECLVNRDGDRWAVTVDLGAATLKEPAGTDIWRVDIGNPHLVVRGPTDEARAREEAVRIQREHRGGVNVEMVLSLDREHRTAEILVNERGAGFTRACGTGGGAVVAALSHAGIVSIGEEWSLRFPGGVIRYRITPERRILMTGYAQIVFSGATDPPAR